MNIRNSKQRTRILELLRSTGSHPTATWLYDKLKKEFPNLSLGTVYRNLNILVEQGLINKIDFGSTFDRYDAKIGKHYHFICEKCDLITDISMPIVDELDKQVISKTGFKVKRHRIEFYGLCKNCRE